MDPQIDTELLGKRHPVKGYPYLDDAVQMSTELHARHQLKLLRPVWSVLADRCILIMITTPEYLVPIAC